MRVHIETCDSNENNPDCDAARKLVAKMMDDETTCEYAPDDECALVWFAVSLMNCWVRVIREKRREWRGDVLSVMCGEEKLVDVTVCALWGVRWRGLVNSGGRNVD